MTFHFCIAYWQLYFLSRDTLFIIHSISAFIHMIPLLRSSSGISGCFGAVVWTCSKMWELPIPDVDEANHHAVH